MKINASRIAYNRLGQTLNLPTELQYLYMRDGTRVEIITDDPLPDVHEDPDPPVDPDQPVV